MNNTANDLDSLRDDILSAAHTMLEAVQGGAANDDFHEARYRLYDIATRDIKPETFMSLVNDPEIQAVAKRIFPVSCQAGVVEECTIARELLLNPNLTFGHIYRNYYGEIYKVLMEDEMSFLQAQPCIDMQKERVAYIGGGALPIPAILLAQHTGCHVTIVDPHPESCELARDLIKRISMDHLIDVAQEFGETYDYSNDTLIFIANWIVSKNEILGRLSEYTNLKYCIFRTAAEQSLSFIINDLIELSDVYDLGFGLEHRTKKRPDVSLESLILSLPGAHEEITDDEAQINARKQMPEVGEDDVTFCAMMHEQNKRTTRVIDSMTDLIGNTPMLRLDPAKTGLKNIEVYAKLEHMNPFGSIKDRTAWAMLKPHIANIKDKGKSVLELSSGNAARGLQAVAAIHGVQLETVSNRIRVKEMMNALIMQGAKISPITEVDPSDAYSALHFVDDKATAEKEEYYYTDQYRNPANDGTHYSQTGREILEDIGAVDYFFGSVGTAGSSVGISRRLKEANADLDITGVISEKEDYIPGLRHKDEIFEIGPFDEKLYSRIEAVTTLEAIDGMIELSRDYGVMAGPSSGATYMAAIKHLREIDATLDQPVQAVFIVCDRMEMYFSWIAERRPDLFGG